MILQWNTRQYEGQYFEMLEIEQRYQKITDEEKQEILLAAKLSRSLLEGEEVVLP